MARPKKDPSEVKSRLTTRIDPGLRDWVEARVGVGKRWSSLTHAIEYALARVKEEEEATTSRGARSPTSKK